MSGEAIAATMTRRVENLVFGGIARSFFLLMLAGGPPQKEPIHYEWPKIAAAEVSYQFNDPENAKVDLPLPGVSDEPLYLLACRGRKQFNSGFAYSADFECILKSQYSDDHYDTLLTYNPRQERPWESRGRFFWDDLYHPCPLSSEYGLVRHFRLRGMTLTLSILDIRRGPVTKHEPDSPAPPPEAFGLKVQVEPDPGALSTIDSQVPMKATETENAPCGLLTRGKRSTPLREDPSVFPEITATSKSGVLPGVNSDFDFADHPLRAEMRGFYLPIKDRNQRMVYHFECSTVAPIVRWGVSCGLFAAGKKVNLLQESMDPYSLMDRGTVFPEQLAGKCADYPDWGSERTFSLRGFKLIMRLTTPVFIDSAEDWGGRGLKSVELSVRVVPDKSVMAPMAIPPKFSYWGFLPWPDACEVPIVNPMRP